MSQQSILSQGRINMSKPTEVFENEEAVKLLDYFVAYKKLLTKLEHIKCVAAANTATNLNENQPQTVNNALNPITDNQLAIGLPPELNK